MAKNERTALRSYVVYLHPDSCLEGMPEGMYACVPYEEWKVFVRALHDAEICVPPKKEEDHG